MDIFNIQFNNIFHEKSTLVHLLLFSGDDKVILHEKGLFNRYGQTVLSDNEGPIDLIKWRGRFAAWSTPNGVRVYDVVQEKMISLIKSEKPHSRDDIENAPTRIAWSDQVLKPI